LFRPSIVVLLTFCVHPLFGGVVLDGSFGKSGALPGPNFMIPAGFGKEVGGNLFQSFSQFNLISSQSATFTGPNTVHNILARVTSGSPSSIDGTVNSSIHGANLFFLNPAGVMFGAHAKINVSGSFAVSTANYLKLVDGGKFNTSLGGTDVLTSAPVSAFGFLSTAPAAVSVTGSALNVASQKSFSAVAGDITMTGGKIAGQGSRVNLVSVKSAGDAKLDATNIKGAVDVSQFTVMGSIDLSSSAKIDMSGLTGGPIVIRGGNLNMDGSQIFSNTSGATQGRAIDIDITGSIKITDGGEIAAGSFGTGGGGSINVTATNKLLIDGTGFTETFNFDTVYKRRIFKGTGILASAYGSGDAGSITVDAPVLSIMGGGQIVAATFGKGDGGFVSVTADSLLIKGTGSVERSLFGTGIFAGAEAGSSGKGGSVDVKAGDATITAVGEIDVGAAQRSSGDAGNITVETTGDTTILNNGRIVASTNSSGKAGDVTVTADSLLIDGVGSFAGIVTNTGLGSGRGGDIIVKADDVEIIRGGEISTGGLAGTGGGGSINVTATNKLLIDGTGSKETFDLDRFYGHKIFKGTGILAAAYGSGDAGNITVDAPVLSIMGGGQIVAATFGTGNGGVVKVTTADSLLIKGTGSVDLSLFGTGVFAGAEAGSIGDGGSITVQGGNATMIAGGEIASGTFGVGAGGKIEVHADSLLIDGRGLEDRLLETDSGPVFFGTGIFANTKSSAVKSGGKILGPGNGGTITVDVERGEAKITDGGEISSSTFGLGNGGSIRVTANSLLIDGFGEFKTATGIFAATHFGGIGAGAGGSIVVDAGDATITNGGEIASSTFGKGDGGTVTVTGGSLLIDGTGLSSPFTGIFAGAEAGSSGNGGKVVVTATSDLKITDGGQIASSTFGEGAGGTVTVTADSLLIDGAGLSFPLTGILANAGLGRTGHGGSVTVQASNLTLTAAGVIGASTASTFGSGKGGDVTVMADSLTLTSSGEIAASTSGAGAGGTVNVTGGDLSLQTSGAISAISSTSAKAGSVSLTLGTLSMDSDSSISSANTGSGDAGKVVIDTTGSATLKDGSNISASSDLSDAGDITIKSGGNIKLKSGSSITGSAGGNGGNILVRTPGLLYLNDSAIKAVASGGGGSFEVDSQFIVLNHSLISTNAAAGQGGNQNLNSDFFFSSDSTVIATGTITITAPPLDLGAQLITLPTSVLSAESQLQERCTALLQGDFSSFISIGRGGTEPAPEELQITF
jgi:filamentous hemagglutinin family protein